MLSPRGVFCTFLQCTVYHASLLPTTTTPSTTYIYVHLQRCDVLALAPLQCRSILFAELIHRLISSWLMRVTSTCVTGIPTRVQSIDIICRIYGYCGCIFNIPISLLGVCIVRRYQHQHYSDSRGSNNNNISSIIRSSAAVQHCYRGAGNYYRYGIGTSISNIYFRSWVTGSCSIARQRCSMQVCDSSGAEQVP